MREFYPPDRWQRILQDRSLPDEQVECLLCARMTATYYWVQLRLLDARGVVGLRDELRGEAWRGTLLGQTHANKIEPEGGYTEADMLPVCKPTDGYAFPLWENTSDVWGVLTRPWHIQTLDRHCATDCGVSRQQLCAGRVCGTHQPLQASRRRYRCCIIVVGGRR